MFQYFDFSTENDINVKQKRLDLIGYEISKYSGLNSIYEHSASEEKSFTLAFRPKTVDQNFRSDMVVYIKK